MAASSTLSNVKVVCRVRPQNTMEKERSVGECVSFQGRNAVKVNNSTFVFDRVLPPDTSQVECFESTAAPLAEEVVKGYNATIFAYGQTSSGKTYTMEGTSENEEARGIIPRSVAALFQHGSAAGMGWNMTAKVSYMEIYMERIRDLLDKFHTRNNLEIREDPQRGIYVSGITETFCSTEQELLDAMKAGSGRRATAATGMNEGSSRSHSVFMITVIMRDVETGNQKVGTLFLVDLAGSEMVRKTNASGQQLQEAKTINKSLSALGAVINALTDKRASHVPYRDSKLTRILQNALGGNSKTVLIINCSPSAYNENETLSTLRFGSRAKLIRNTPTINAHRSVNELTSLLVRAERVIDVQTTYISALEAQLHTCHARGVAPATPSSETNLLGRIAQLTVDLEEERRESQRQKQEIEILRRHIV